MGKTTFEKIWDAHVVKSVGETAQVIYIDNHFIHEVTSPQAFTELNKQDIKVFRPKQTTATVDHNIPTKDQHLPIADELSRLQVQKLVENCKDHNVELFGIGHENQGIVHVIGPEMGITQPGMTIVCGDSHTSTHGAFGNISFGIGTSQVAQALASQCIIASKPKTMRIIANGSLAAGVTSKDLILYIISKLGTAGGTGYFVEYAGPVFEKMTMEERMTVCNMTIEMGARGGLIAPDQTTFDYLKDKPMSPKGEEWDKKVAEWRLLKSDNDAVFDHEVEINADVIIPMITYGTSPDAGIGISEKIPEKTAQNSKALQYMNFEEHQELEGQPIDYVFIGSCTNSRIEDLRAAAQIIKGNKKAENTTVWVVPGSRRILKQAQEEGLVDIFESAGIPFREPGCSACLAMNEDKVPAGSLCVSTSNRNFEGRQGEGSRTLLASPLTAAASAITGKITDPRKFLN